MREDERGRGRRREGKAHLLQGTYAMSVASSTSYTHISGTGLRGRNVYGGEGGPWLLDATRGSTEMWSTTEPLRANDDSGSYSVAIYRHHMCMNASKTGITNPPTRPAHNCMPNQMTTCPLPALRT